MDKSITLTFLLALAAAPPAACQESWSAARVDSLLARVDRYRGLAEDHRCDIEISGFERDKGTGSNLYRARVHPSERRRDVLLRVLSPESEKGNLILSRGREMWILTRRTSRPVPVSAQQRLLGDASIGDVLNVELHGSYAGTARPDGNALLLELAATAPAALYERIELRVDPATARPLEARLLARTGRLLKTVRYRGFLRSSGLVLASDLEILDAVNPDRTTRVRFSRFAPERFPSGTFEKETLGSLRASE